MIIKNYAKQSGLSKCFFLANTFKLKRISLCLLLLALTSSPFFQNHLEASQEFISEKHSFRVEVVAENLSRPWSLAFLPDGDVLLTERPGRLRIIRQGTLLPDPVPGLPAIRAVGQGGLLDLALHPDFSVNRWLYFSYSADHLAGVSTHVARGKFINNSLQDVEILFRGEPTSQDGAHFGSRLAFDRQGYLFVTIGDRGNMESAQDLNDHGGSTLRLHDDGSIPTDNPFFGLNDSRAEIYSYGHRNAQGMVLHPQTGAIWQHEHGPKGGDEINLIGAGLNYGWPVITYGTGYDDQPIGEGTEKEGMEQPLYYWTPSIAPSGMTFYTGRAFPRWRTNLFIGSLVQKHLTRLEMNGLQVIHEERLLVELGLRIRDVRTAPDGSLWLLTDHDPGQVLRLEPLDSFKVDLLGTWEGQGVYYRNSDTGSWVKMASPASLITAGDVDGDGIDNLIGVWPGQGGVWVKSSSNDNWTLLSSTAQSIAAGDMNGDGRVDLVGTWDGQGVFYRNSISGAWVKMASPATLVTAGDLDGDGADDLIGIWPGQGGVWVKYSTTNSWAQLSSTSRHIAAGDMNGDGRVDLVGTWDGQGVFYRNSVSGTWVQLANPADLVAAGDLDGDGTDDLIGIWPGQGGVWVKYSATNSWAQLSSSAEDISAGRMRAAGGSDLDLIALKAPEGGADAGPELVYREQSLLEEGPGGMYFSADKEVNLLPVQSADHQRFPGPGEPGFTYRKTENLLPGSRMDERELKKEQRSKGSEYKTD